jgi:hypothetical protein
MPSKEQLVGAIKSRLEQAGWRSAPAAAADTFAGLIPAPDAVLALRADAPALQSLAALHFAETDGHVSYACTLHLPTGRIAVERGRIDAATLAVNVAESRISPSECALEAAPAPAAKVAAAAVAEDRSAPSPTDESLHPLLAAIVAGTAATGWHLCRWAELRRTVFPGQNSWSQLKAWCASRSLECELCFGGSSKTADVQFRRVRST